MKKKRIQNIIVVASVILIIGSVISYNYSVDMTKQKGLQFGIELDRIQRDVSQLQTKFYSEKTRWDEGDISKEELLEFYDKHLEEFREIIFRYDRLIPPELFKSSVKLLRISSETQLESDLQFIKWIKTRDESAKIRSDMQFQEALEYEMSGLVEFYSAKMGVKNYEEPEKFKAPQNSLKHKVIKVSENMKSQCDKEFKNGSGGFDSEKTEFDWLDCTNDAEKWKTEHLP